MIEPYLHSKHYMVVRSWLQNYGLASPEQRLFSSTGFVVDATAIGFLYLTNSKQAYIDHVVANPRRSKLDRTKALNFLFHALEDAAKDAGVLLVTAVTRVPAMKARLEKIGYTKKGDYSLYYKVLTARGKTCLE